MLDTVKKFIECSLGNVHRYQVLYKFSHCVYFGSYFFHCSITETESSSKVNTIWNLKYPCISSYKARHVCYLKTVKVNVEQNLNSVLVFCVFEMLPMVFSFCSLCFMWRPVNLVQCLTTSCQMIWTVCIFKCNGTD